MNFLHQNNVVHMDSECCCHSCCCRCCTLLPSAALWLVTRPQQPRPCVASLHALHLLQLEKQGIPAPLDHHPPACAPPAVKSPNILLTASGTAKLADVGFSKTKPNTYLSTVSLVGTCECSEAWSCSCSGFAGVVAGQRGTNCMRRHAELTLHRRPATHPSFSPAPLPCRSCLVRAGPNNISLLVWGDAVISRHLPLHASAAAPGCLAGGLPFISSHHAQGNSTLKSPIFR